MLLRGRPRRESLEAEGLAKRVLKHSKHKSIRKQGKIPLGGKMRGLGDRLGGGWGGQSRKHTVLIPPEFAGGGKQNQNIPLEVQFPNPVFLPLINFISFESMSFAYTTQTLAKVLATDLLQGTLSPPLRT